MRAGESFVVSAGEEGERLDQLVAGLKENISRSLIQRLVSDGGVRLNGRYAKASQRVHAGDTVEVDDVVAPSLSARPDAAIELDVVYEDESMAVIDKPAGLVVHPAAGHESATLVNGLLARYPSLGERNELRPGLVHRLDKDTSGLMVIALNAEAQKSLAEQVRTRRMRRLYLALVSGQLSPDRGVIDIPVGRDPASRKRMSAGMHSIHPRHARTRYRVDRQVQGFTLVDITLETGRTHQIRVHMAYIGHPVVGDPTYSSGPALGLHRQFLHARALELESPGTKQSMRFESALPADLRMVLDRLQEEEERTQTSSQTATQERV